MTAACRKSPNTATPQSSNALRSATGPLQTHAPQQTTCAVATRYSITSSARVSSVRGISRPIKLMTKVEFGRLLDRDVARLRPAQDLVDALGGVTELWIEP